MLGSKTAPSQNRPSREQTQHKCEDNIIHLYVGAQHKQDYLFRWLELRFLKGEQGLL